MNSDPSKVLFCEKFIRVLRCMHADAQNPTSTLHWFLNAGTLQSFPLNKNFVPKFRLLSRRDKQKEFLQILIHSNSFLTWAQILLIPNPTYFSASILDPYHPSVDFHLIFVEFLALPWLRSPLSKIFFYIFMRSSDMFGGTLPYIHKTRKTLFQIVDY